ncbi:hypothetical protein VPH35_105479 [Triticum aestivum]
MPRAWSRGFTSRCISSATPETSCNIKMLVSCLHLFATVAASCQVLRAGIWRGHKFGCPAPCLHVQRIQNLQCSR